MSRVKSLVCSRLLGFVGSATRRSYDSDRRSYEAELKNPLPRSKLLEESVMRHRPKQR
ncbi:hypothetical protein KIN20_025598, partial [Parelaphostrongylus tenuis]